jgi:hypothetical protein
MLNNANRLDSSNDYNAIQYESSTLLLRNDNRGNLNGYDMLSLVVVGWTQSNFFAIVTPYVLPVDDDGVCSGAL